MADDNEATNPMEVDEDLQAYADKVEAYEADLGIVEDELRDCVSKAKTLGVELEANRDKLEAYQERRKYIKNKIKKYKRLAHDSVGDGIGD